MRSRRGSFPRPPDPKAPPLPFPCPNGRLPLATRGGLKARGHPVGATGVYQIVDVVQQLRGEAGPRQVQGASLGLIENGGGVMGFDEAACAIHILEKSS